MWCDGSQGNKIFQQKESDHWCQEAAEREVRRGLTMTIGLDNREVIASVPDCVFSEVMGDKRLIGLA